LYKLLFYIYTMKNIQIIYLAALFAVYCNGCKTKINAERQVVKIDGRWLDSIIKKSDSSWVKPYRNNTLVSSEYYLNRKDSIITQLMKDSAGTIRQISIAKYDKIRLFFGAYYANGQLMNRLAFDSLGAYHGTAKQYYESGMVKSSGNYTHGFRNGQWLNFNAEGRLISTDTYDANGQLVKTVAE
jgi:antitoxin component YwqK of YwqJK toxin-antitoxin module